MHQYENQYTDKSLYLKAYNHYIGRYISKSKCWYNFFKAWLQNHVKIKSPRTL